MIGTIVEVAAKLLPPLVRWIVELVEAGETPEEAEAIIRRDIEDRRAEIAANRAKVDEAMRRKKYGSPVG